MKDDSNGNLALSFRGELLSSTKALHRLRDDEDDAINRSTRNLVVEMANAQSADTFSIENENVFIPKIFVFVILSPL